MIIRLHKKFEKSLKNQPRSIQTKLKKRIKIFQEDQFHYSLNNHALSDKFLGIRSFNITGDIRVHYKELEGVIVLINIGSHSELY